VTSPIGPSTPASAALIATGDSCSPLGETGLLPDPTAQLSGAALNDAMGALYLSLSQQRQLSMQSGEASVRADQALHDQQLADETAALQRQLANEAENGRGFFGSIGHLFDDMAQDVADGHLSSLFGDISRDADQAWNSPAFWSDLEKGALAVAKVALAVGAVAATVATAGAGGVLVAGAAVALSAGGTAVTETHCFGGASTGVGLSLELGGAALGFAGGLAAVGAGTGSRVIAAVGAGCTVAGGGAEAVAGGAHIRNGDFAVQAQDAAADAEQANLGASQLQTIAEWVVDELKASDKTQQRAEESLTGAMQTNDQAAVSAASISLRG